MSTENPNIDQRIAALRQERPQMFNNEGQRPNELFLAFEPTDFVDAVVGSLHKHGFPSARADKNNRLGRRKVDLVPVYIGDKDYLSNEHKANSIINLDKITEEN